MTLGTLYIAITDGEPRRTRVILPEALIKHFKLDIKLSGPDAEFPAKFATGPFVPAYKYADGSHLTESIPIAFYLVDQIPNHGGLLGDGSNGQRALILSWMYTFNYDLMSNITVIFKMLAGRQDYDKKVYDQNLAGLNKLVPIIEKHLTAHTYLVGEKLSLADLYCSTYLLRGFEFFLDAKWRKEHRAITRWFNTVTKSAIWNGYWDNFKPIEVAKAPPS